MAVQRDWAGWKMVDRMDLAVLALMVDRNCFWVGQFAYFRYYSQVHRRAMHSGAGQRRQGQMVGQR